MRKLLTLLLFTIPFLAIGQIGIYPQATASGTDTYTATVSGLTSYQANQRFTIKFTNANTGASTLTLTPLAAVPIKENGSTALAAGRIGANSIKLLIYDGTNFQIVGDGIGSSGDALVSNPLSQFASTTSTQLAGVLSDESGTGTVVFSSVTDGKQASLVSGTNIKTINGSSVLGSGNLSIGGLYPATNRQTTDYTLVLADDGKTVEMNSAGSVNLTVPANASVAFPTYTQISIAQYGAGQVSILAAGGVTLRSSSGALTTSGQYSVVVIYKIGTNEWYVWDGTPSSILSPTYGGTGVNNGSKTITLGGNLTTTGAFNTDIAVTGSNTITFPNASITVARSDAAQTFTGVQTFSSAPVFSSSFTLPNGTIGTTQSASDNSTKVATTAYVDAAVGGGATSWSLASGGTLSGANTIIGTTTNTLKFRFNALGTTQTNGAGLLFANETAAANGAQQISPSAVFEGQGWGSGANTSQPVRYAMYTIPLQNTTNPLGTFVIASSINGGAYSTLLTFGSGANATATFTAGVTAGTGSFYSWSGRCNVTSPSTSAITFNQSSGSANAILNAGTLVLGYAAKTGTYAITTSDHFIECTSGSFTVTLPTAVGVPGKIYVIDNSGAGTITIATTSSQTIDGSAPGTLAGGVKLTVYSNGANWRTY
jgi:hypothetical protein